MKAFERIMEYAIRWKHQRGRSSWSTMGSLALWDAIDDLERQLPSMLDAAEADLRTVKNNIAGYTASTYRERVEELEGRIAILRRLWGYLMDELTTNIVGTGLLLVAITFAASYAIGYYNANNRWILRASSFEKTLFTRGEMYYVTTLMQHCQEKEWLRNEVWRAATGEPLIPDKMPLLRMANEEGIDITKMNEKEREELYRAFLRRFQMVLEHRTHDEKEHYGP